MGNVELERISYIGFVSGKFEEKCFYNYFAFSAEEKIENFFKFFMKNIFSSKLQNFKFSSQICQK
jgi:hypothetical protein